MIDLTQLTQEQQWGVEYACLEANKPIQAENEATEKANETAEEQKPLKPLYTPASYMEHVIRVACDSYYSQLVESKKKMALNLFDSLTPEQQQALVQQLQIPDVLPQ